MDSYTTAKTIVYLYTLNITSIMDLPKTIELNKIQLIILYIDLYNIMIFCVDLSQIISANPSITNITNLTETKQ